MNIFSDRCEFTKAADWSDRRTSERPADIKCIIYQLTSRLKNNSRKVASPKLNRWAGAWEAPNKSVCVNSAPKRGNP